MVEEVSHELCESVCFIRQTPAAGPIGESPMSGEVFGYKHGMYSVSKADYAFLGPDLRAHRWEKPNIQGKWG